MTEKDEKITMSKNTIIALFMGAIFILAAFQTVQLSELKQEINIQNNEITQLQGTTNLAAVSVQTQQSQSVPSSLQNLPDMVGGC